MMECVFPGSNQPLVQNERMEKAFGIDGNVASKNMGVASTHWEHATMTKIAIE